MRYRDIAPLSESIKTTLARETWDTVSPAIDQWLKDIYAKALDVAALTEINAEIEEQERQQNAAWRTNDYKTADRIGNRLSDKKSETYTAFRRGLEYTLFGVEEFKVMLEDILQRLAREQIERNLGKIDPFVRGVPYDDQKGKHLMWLQHIIVQIKTDSTSKKTGRLRTGGGHFAALPNQDYYTSQYVKQEVDWRKDLGVGISIYATPKAINAAIVNRLVNRMQEDYFGEPMENGDPMGDLIHDMIGTYVHEVVHLEQDARRRTKNPRALTTGTTDTPAPGKSRRTSHYSWDQNAPVTRGSPKKNKLPSSSRKYKAGKRGNPDHIMDDDWGNIPRITDYYGTAHEIEAHAAGAAAGIVAALRKEQSTRRRHYGSDGMQVTIDLNRHIDEAVNELKAGYWPDNFSIQQQVALMRDSLARMQTNIDAKMSGYLYRKSEPEFFARDPEATPKQKRRYARLPKADALHRKVWRIFMTKLAHFLLAYKKPLPDDADEWTREDNPEPRPAKVGGITHPARRPQLP